MGDFFGRLFDNGFMPHGQSYQWQADVVWLHAVSDGLIALSYYAIPFFLLYFAMKRRDVEFRGVLLMFSLFIFLCGTTHVLEVWSIWNGTYRLTGLVKLLTAITSMATAILLVPLMPKALRLPGPSQLSAANEALRSEDEARQLAERELQLLNEALERRVAERTAELVRLNDELNREMAERRRTEGELRRIEWLLKRSSAGVDGAGSDVSPSPERHRELAALGTSRVIRDSVADDVLQDVSGAYLDLLDTSTAIYERNGDYAFGIATSGWCRFMDDASRGLCGTEDHREALNSGKWHCHESCIEVSRQAMETGEPADAPCLGGIRLYAVPILVDEEVVGSINFGYGDPPRDPERLGELAERYEVDPESLARHAEAYASRPPFIIEVAKQRLRTSARMLGEIIHRTRTEAALRESEARLRGLNTTLEQSVAQRTVALKMANDQLAQRNQELQEFAYIASHDLREPLRKISTFADLLKEECGDALPEAGRDYLARMRDASGRMLNLLDGLLAFSRVSTRPEHFEQVDLNDVIRDVLSDLEVPLRESGGEVQVSLLPAVEASPTQMRQLFQNLVGNALKFRKKGASPHLRIEAQPDVDARGDVLIIRFQDDGIGFEEKYASRIFAPFQRLHGRGEYDGTGMGLAICRRIVERHDGTIRAWSTPGEGSTFEVRLPLMQNQQDLQQPPAEEASLALPSATARMGEAPS